MKSRESLTSLPPSPSAARRSRAIKYSIAMGIRMVCVICLIFAPQIISFFRDDPEVIKVGIVALRWQAAALPLSATVVMTNMMLQSMGKGIPASITASARNGLFFIPMILLLPRIFGLFGVEITQACADVLSIAVSVPLAARVLRKMKETGT